MIFLIRHGETQLNATRVVQPADTPLNARGMRQAELLAERLRSAGISHVLCSDLPRACMTAEPLLRATSACIEHSELLQERNFGDVRGRPYAELGIDIFAPDYVPPAGESWPVFHERVTRAWERAVELAGAINGHLAVVSHGLVCASVASRFLRLPDGASVPPRWGNTSVTVCAVDSPHAVEVLNCVAHLDGDDDRAAPSGL